MPYLSHLSFDLSVPSGTNERVGVEEEDMEKSRLTSYILHMTDQASPCGDLQKHSWAFSESPTHTVLQCRPERYYRSTNSRTPSRTVSGELQKRYDARGRENEMGDKKA